MKTTIEKQLDALADEWEHLDRDFKAYFMAKAPDLYFATAKVARYWQVRQESRR